ncbi:hypothetical protein R80B4_03006 [Fibrobacteres bacterium R8-0-B4]
MISNAIRPPKTYSEWVELFDMLKSKTDDGAVLQALHGGTVEWQSGVAERFAKKLTDTINARMNAASDKFQRDMNNARGHEGHIVQALLALRKEMSFLSQAINLPAIPEKDRDQYYRLVLEQADKMQTSLEDSAKKDRTGKMTSIVRNHKVNTFCGKDEDK